MLRAVLDHARALAEQVRAFAEGRSPKWPALRDRWLREHPECAVCGRRDKLEAHHVEPFHVNPLRELDETNLLSMCNPGDGGCHLRFGHLWSWLSWNTSVREDAAAWREKVRTRPPAKG